jgi:hypothetical protein
LAPKVYFDEQDGGSYFMTNDMVKLILGDGTPMSFPHQPGNTLPMMLTSRHFNNELTTAGLTFEDTNMLANVAVATKSLKL